MAAKHELALDQDASSALGQFALEVSRPDLTVGKDENAELNAWSTIDLLAQQQERSDEWFLGPEGYAAFESSAATPSKAKSMRWLGFRISSAQLAADRGDYYDF